MKLYRCNKLVKAQPMNKEQYCDLRGWIIPSDEDPKEAGYLVEYVDSNNPNHTGYTGYISWSPKDVFERGYVEESEEN